MIKQRYAAFSPWVIWPNGFHFQQSLLSAIINIYYVMWHKLKMQNSSEGSLQGCAGVIPSLAPGPWWVPVAPRFARMRVRGELQVSARRFWVCVQLNLISYLCIWKCKQRQGFVVFVNIKLATQACLTATSFEAMLKFLFLFIPHAFQLSVNKRHDKTEKPHVKLEYPNLVAFEAH